MAVAQAPAHSKVERSPSRSQRKVAGSAESALVVLMKVSFPLVHMESTWLEVINEALGLVDFFGVLHQYAANPALWMASTQVISIYNCPFALKVSGLVTLGIHWYGHAGKALPPVNPWPVPEYTPVFVQEPDIFFPLLLLP